MATRSSSVSWSTQHVHGVLDQGQLVFVAHRAGDVQQKHQVAGSALFGVDLAALEPDPHQTVFGVPGTLGRLHVDREGHLVVGLRVVVAEVVDQFLVPHGVGRRQPTGVEKAADVGVGGGVDVDGEGRFGVIGGGEEGVFDDGVVLLGAGGNVWSRRA